MISAYIVTYLTIYAEVFFYAPSSSEPMVEYFFQLCRAVCGRNCCYNFVLYNIFPAYFFCTENNDVPAVFQHNIAVLRRIIGRRDMRKIPQAARSDRRDNMRMHIKRGCNCGFGGCRGISGHKKTAPVTCGRSSRGSYGCEFQAAQKSDVINNRLKYLP